MSRGRRSGQAAGKGVGQVSAAVELSVGFRIKLEIGEEFRRRENTIGIRRNGGILHGLRGARNHIRGTYLILPPISISNFNFNFELHTLD